MTTQKDQINLLPSKRFEKTTTGRVLSWTISTFRIIVIITEIIVMIAFISRFWLDSINTDLSDEIKEKTSVLLAFSEFEHKFKDTQKRLKIFSDIIKDSDFAYKTLTSITSFLPIDLFLTSLSIRENSVEIEGSTPNETSIQQFIVNLHSTNRFEEINLISLESNIVSSSLLDFKISATFKK